MARKVLFICVQNSFRSQVAEAFFNANPPVGWVAVSAGPKPAAGLTLRLFNSCGSGG